MLAIEIFALFVSSEMANAKTVVINTKDDGDLKEISSKLKENGFKVKYKKKKNTSFGWLTLIGPFVKKNQLDEARNSLFSMGYYNAKPIRYKGKVYLTLGVAYSTKLKNYYQRKLSQFSIKLLKSKSALIRNYYEIRALPGDIAESDEPTSAPEKEDDSDLYSEVDLLVSLEARYFSDDFFKDLDSYSGSVTIQPKYSIYWNNDRQVLSFVPYYKYDSLDSNRSHFDLRELSWVGAFDDIELRVGFSKVFWGVTESLHLVDVINQTDFVEDIDSEEKLGQAMLNVNWLTSYGVFGFFILPLFRERTFSGEKGRPNFILPVDVDSATYYSEKKEEHVDFAARYSSSFGALDLGLSFFRGTSRDPELIPGFNNSGDLVLTPFYDLMSQVGLDFQLTLGGLLLKFEGIRRWPKSKRHFEAIVSGLEYSFYGLIGAADMTLVAEYLHNNSREGTPFFFEDDYFVAMRWALNDVSDTTLLAGLYVDKDEKSKSARVEFSSRISNSLSLRVEYSGFYHVAQEDPMIQFEEDDYIVLELSAYF